MLTVNKSTAPPFVPLALELGTVPPFANEPVHDFLVESYLGNYWLLFASLALHLEFPDTDVPFGDLVGGYLDRHGGLWAGLPRFYAGLDAAYTIGYVYDLIRRCVHDIAQYRAHALN